jgi:hypothetical protein
MLESQFDNMSKDMRNKMQSHLHALLNPRAAMQQEIAEMQARKMKYAEMSFAETTERSHTSLQSYNAKRDEVRERHAKRMQQLS